MIIGDRVRVLHGNEEGIVTKVIDPKTVEIEIEDGFSFPVLISDLVIVTSQEDKFFSEKNVIPTGEEKNDIYADRGIYLALELEDESDKYILHLLNNTDINLVCIVSRKEGKLKYGCLFRGLVNTRSAVKITEFKQDRLPSFSEIYCQILLSETRPGALKSPLERQVRMAGILAGEQTTETPIIKNPAWIKQLDDKEEEQIVEIQISEEDLHDIPKSEIDLHAEALGINDQSLSSVEILEQQIRVFNESLDKAVIHGLSEITFIHGVGQGVLKKRIIMETRHRKEVRFWQDAKKEEFGYGATKIVL